MHVGISENLTATSSTTAHDALVFVLQRADHGSHIVFLGNFHAGLLLQLGFVDSELNGLSSRLGAEVVHTCLQALKTRKRE